MNYKSKPSMAINTSASLLDELNNFNAYFEVHNLDPVTGAQSRPDKVVLQVTEADE